MTNGKSIGVAFSDPQLDAGTRLTPEASALTTQLTTITSAGPSTPDYAVQALTLTTPYGFATKDEGETVLTVIANLQTRVAELEAALQTIGVLP